MMTLSTRDVSKTSIPEGHSDVCSYPFLEKEKSCVKEEDVVGHNICGFTRPRDLKGLTASKSVIPGIEVRRRRRSIDGFKVCHTLTILVDPPFCRSW